MEFELTEEQQSLQVETRRFLTARAGSGLRDAVDHRASFDRATWTTLTQELGLAGIAVDEEFGGAGGSFLDLAVVLEETGRALACLPFFSTAVLGTLPLLLSDDRSAKERFLPLIASGQTTATLAYREPTGHSTTIARESGGGWSLTGTKTTVVDGTTADLILVTARTDNGLSLFTTSGSAAGLTRERLDAFDPTRPLARLDFEDTPATLVGAAGAAQGLLDTVLATARIALAAEQLGAAEAALDLAVEYAKSRNQFGRPIGSFQSIKHLCADMFLDVETSRAASLFAAWNVASGGTYSTDSLLADTTHSYVSEAFYRVAATALQIFGGIGYTWEHDGHFYYKRAVSSARLLGTLDRSLDNIATQIGLDDLGRECQPAQQ